MKLALAGIIAFLASYAGGGLLFVSSSDGESNNLLDLKPSGSRSGGTVPPSAIAHGTGSGDGTDLAAEKAYLERVVQTAPGDLAELYRSSLRDPHRSNPVAKHWAETDPAGMFDSLQPLAVDSPDRHYTALWYLFNAWAKSDPEAAIAAARPMGKLGANNFDPLSSAIGGLMESNPKAAIAFIEENPDEVQWLGLPVWAKADPKSATEILGPLLHTKRFRYALDALARNYMKDDPAAAIAWASSLDWKSRARVQFLMGKAALGNGDLDTARAVFDLPNFRRTELRGELGTDYASKLAETHPAEALAWASENLSGSPRVNAMYRVIDNLATVDLGAALRFHDDLPPGSARESVASQLAQSWAKLDRPAALAWVGDLEGRAKERALRGIGFDWLNDDAPAALAFAAEHPDVQPTFYSQHARNLSQREQYDTTLEWIATLPDSDARTKVATDTLGQWTYRNPDKASAYVDSLAAGVDREHGIATVAGRYFSVSEPQALDWVRSLPASDLASVIEGIEERITNAEQKQRLLDAIKSIAR